MDEFIGVLTAHSHHGESTYQNPTDGKRPLGIAALEKTELEDLYLPYKPKRRTKASIAREKGLEPLAQWLWDQTGDTSLPELAARFVNHALGVASPEDADYGMILGTGFAPLRGGPLRFADHFGIAEMVAAGDRHGGKFKPCDLLRQHAEKGTKFYKE